MPRNLGVTFLFGVAASLAIGCGQETRVAAVPQEPPKVEEPPENPTADAGDPAPELERKNPHLYYWRTSEDAPARIVFDNGTDARLLVRLAENAPIEIAPRDYAELKSNYGPLTFSVSDSDDPKWREITCDLENTWIYNHRAAWDYEFTTATYSNLSFAPDTDEPQEIVGQVLFQVEVFYLFEAAPEKVTLWTLSEDKIPVAVRCALERCGDPNPGRVVRQFANPQGENGYVVLLEADDRAASYAVEYPFRDEDWIGRRVRDGSAELSVGNQGSGKVRIEVDGALVGEVADGLLARVYLDPGKHRIRRLSAEGAVIQDAAAEFQARTKYELDVDGVEQLR